MSKNDKPVLEKKIEKLEKRVEKTELNAAKVSQIEDAKRLAVVHA